MRYGIGRQPFTSVGLLKEVREVLIRYATRRYYVIASRIYIQPGTHERLAVISIDNDQTGDRQPYAVLRLHVEDNAS